ncbi:MAG: hypothetical protein WAU07_05065, partial [Microgenomates group bacterium]
AKIVYGIPNARPLDWMALGHNVLVEYPEVEKLPVVGAEESTGTQLVEVALLYAFQNRISHVFAYSRPADYHEFLTKTR